MPKIWTWFWEKSNLILLQLFLLFLNWTHVEQEWSWLWSLWQSSTACSEVCISSPEEERQRARSWGGTQRHVSPAVSHQRAAEGQVWCGSTVPGPLQDRRLDVVFVSQLRGHGGLLSRGHVGRVHLQSYNTHTLYIIIILTLYGSVHTEHSELTVRLPMDLILAWLGAWALGFSFFFSSSVLFSFTSLRGTFPSSFFFFLSATQIKRVRGHRNDILIILCF